MSGKWLHKFERKPGRWVFAPTSETKMLGLKIKAQIEEVWTAPDYFFHLQAGGHIGALKTHHGRSSFLRLDIEDFFGSVNRSRVTRCLTPYFGYAKAREMAVESTVQHPTEKGRYVLP